MLISFGTSKGVSAGHMALAIRDPATGEDLVHSANFYADRDPGHAENFCIDELMIRVPKMEYLFATTSSLGDKASFGLDFGESCKRSVIGVRVRGVPAHERQALAAYFERINDDYRQRAWGTEYHDREVKYEYLRLNCAKTIGSAFKYGADYKDLDVTQSRLLSGRRLVAAANANIPTKMTMKLLREWHARGYGLDVVLYRKVPGSDCVDPHEGEGIAFKDLPDRFAAVLSRDFRRETGEYEDADNFFAMYLLADLRRCDVRLDGATRQLAIVARMEPLPYAHAATRAEDSPKSDSAMGQQHERFAPQGTRIGETATATTGQ